MPDNEINPSNTWSENYEDSLTCDEDWGLSTQKGDSSSIKPYKTKTVDGVYTISDVDQNYIIEFKGIDMDNVLIDSNTETYDLQETTLVSAQPFTLTISDSVTMNSVSGPASWTVAALSNSVLIKKVGPYNWLAFGDLEIV